jgi:hypothetical protein
MLQDTITHALGELPCICCFNGHPPLGVNATTTHHLAACGLTQGGRSFNGHPPLGVNATCATLNHNLSLHTVFNGHPPLGVNATITDQHQLQPQVRCCFNGHPPLGVNATGRARTACWFQWAPTLGGECYAAMRRGRYWFQWAPTLGGECYASCRQCRTGHPRPHPWSTCFNGHPPLGVNATKACLHALRVAD